MQQFSIRDARRAGTRDDEALSAQLAPFAPVVYAERRRERSIASGIELSGAALSDEAIRKPRHRRSAGLLRLVSKAFQIQADYRLCSDDRMRICCSRFRWNRS